MAGDVQAAAKRQRTLPAGLDQPTWLIEIALRAIHPDAAFRFQNATDSAAALRARSMPITLDRNAKKAHRAVWSGKLAIKCGRWRNVESAAAVVTRRASKIAPQSISRTLVIGSISSFVGRAMAQTCS